MRDIRASVQVRVLIGAEKHRELHEDASARYEFWQCGWTGRMTEPTSAIVLGYGVFRVAKLAHAACADSQIIEVDAAAMGTAAGQLPRRSASKLPEQAGGLAAARTSR